MGPLLRRMDSQVRLS